MDLAPSLSDECSDVEELNSENSSKTGGETETLRRLLEMIPIGVLVVDGRGNCLFHNRSAREILGGDSAGAVRSAELRMDADWWLPDKSRVLSPEEMPLALALRGEAVQDELFYLSGERMSSEPLRSGPRPDGRWIRASAWEIRDGGGFIGSAALLVREVTSERCEQSTGGLFSQVVDRIADAVMLTDRDGVIEYVNPAFEASTGFSTEEVRGRTPRILKSGMQDAEFYEHMWSELREGRSFQAILSNRKKNGETYQVDETITHLTDEEGNTSHFVAVIRDTTEALRRQEQEVQLRLAREIQKKFYRAAPPISGFDVAAAAHAAYQTSGDYFDFIPLPGNRMCIAVGDVEGHGFGSALVMALTRAYVHSFAALGLQADEMLTRVNRMLLDDLGDGCFVTLLLVVLDLSSRSMVCAGAGHIPGYVLGVDGSTEYTLESSGPPLGLFPSVSFSRSSPVMLQPGQLVALMTDGITEAASPDGTEWGARGVLDYLAKHRARPARQLVDGLYEEAVRYAGHHPHKDDMTSVVIKVD